MDGIKNMYFNKKHEILISVSEVTQSFNNIVIGLHD